MERLVHNSFDTPTEVGLKMGGGISMGAFPDRAHVLCVTAGYLVRRMNEDDTLLEAFDCVVVDEVHDRSMEADLLCLMMRRMMKLYPRLKVVLMSATLATKLYAKYFNVAESKVLFVGAHRYPTKKIFLEDLTKEFKDLSKGTINSAMTAITSNESSSPAAKLAGLQHLLVIELLTKHFSIPHTCVLVFVPGIQAIDDLFGKIEALNTSIERPSKSSSRAVTHYNIFALHSTIPMKDQFDALFDEAAEPGQMKVILATNMADTSITLPSCSAVIDLGVCKTTHYDAKARRTILKPAYISQGSAIQRAGRTGRTGPGTCVRLYTETLYSTMDDHAPPSMLVEPLESVVMQLKSIMQNQERASQVLAETLQPPKSGNIDFAVKYLHEDGFLEHLDETSELTKMGEFASVLGVDLRVSAFLFKCLFAGVFELGILVASGISMPKSPFRYASKYADIPPGLYNAQVSGLVKAKAHLDQGRYSEPMMLARLLQLYACKTVSHGEFCKKHWVTFDGMQMLSSQYRQMRLTAMQFKADNQVEFQGVLQEGDLMGGSTDLMDPVVVNKIRVLLFGVSFSRGYIMESKTLNPNERQSILKPQVNRAVPGTQPREEFLGYRLEGLASGEVEAVYKSSFRYAEDLVVEEVPPLDSPFPQDSKGFKQDNAVHAQALKVAETQTELNETGSYAACVKRCEEMELTAWDLVKRIDVLETRAWEEKQREEEREKERVARREEQFQKKTQEVVVLRKKRKRRSEREVVQLGNQGEVGDQGGRGNQGGMVQQGVKGDVLQQGTVVAKNPPMPPLDTFEACLSVWRKHANLKKSAAVRSLSWASFVRTTAKSRKHVSHNASRFWARVWEENTLDLTQQERDIVEPLWTQANGELSLKKLGKKELACFKVDGSIDREGRVQVWDTYAQKVFVVLSRALEGEDKSKHVQNRMKVVKKHWHDKVKEVESTSVVNIPATKKVSKKALVQRKPIKQSPVSKPYTKTPLQIATRALSDMELEIAYLKEKTQHPPLNLQPATPQSRLHLVRQLKMRLERLRQLLMNNLVVINNQLVELTRANIQDEATLLFQSSLLAHKHTRTQQLASCRAQMTSLKKEIPTKSSSPFSNKVITSKLTGLLFTDQRSPSYSLLDDLPVARKQVLACARFMRGKDRPFLGILTSQSKFGEVLEVESRHAKANWKMQGLGNCFVNEDQFLGYAIHFSREVKLLLAGSMDVIYTDKDDTVGIHISVFPPSSSWFLLASLMHEEPAKVGIESNTVLFHSQLLLCAEYKEAMQGSEPVDVSDLLDAVFSPYYIGLLNPDLDLSSIYASIEELKQAYNTYQASSCDAVFLVLNTLLDGLEDVFEDEQGYIPVLLVEQVFFRLVGKPFRSVLQVCEKAYGGKVTNRSLAQVCDQDLEMELKVVNMMHTNLKTRKVEKVMWVRTLGGNSEYTSSEESGSEESEECNYLFI